MISQPAHGSRNTHSLVLPSRHNAARRCAVALFALVFALAMQWGYITFVSPQFDRIGYVYSDPGIRIQVQYALASAILALPLPLKFRRAGDLSLWILYALATLPSIALPVLTGLIEPTKLLQVSFAIAGAWLVIVFISTLNFRTDFQFRSIPDSAFWAAISIFTLATYGALFSATGFSLQFSALTEVRDVRLEFRDTLKTLPPLAGYLLTAQSNIVNPILLILGAKKRNLLLIVAGVVGQVVIYGITGSRMTLLSVPIVLIALLISRPTRRYLSMWIFPGLTALVVVAILVNDFFGDPTLALLIVARLIATPGVLTAAYVSVFDQLGFINWTVVTGGLTGEYALPLPPSFMVGWLFSNDPIVSANANVYADGYMQAGVLGIFVEATLTGLMLLAINQLAKGADKSLASALLIIPSIALSNTGIFPALLTHGFLFGAAILTFVKLSQQEPETYSSPTQKESP